MFIRKCPYCLREMRRGSGHIYKCKNRDMNLTKKEHRFNFLNFNFPLISKKEILEEEYAYSSLCDLKNKYNIDYKSTLFLLDFFKIKTRNMSESSVLISKDKFKKTCLKKYGAVNVLSKGTVGYNKKNKTIKEKYNVDNIFQVKEIKEKIFNDMLYITKYGCSRNQLLSKRSKEVWNRKTDEEKNEWLIKSINNPDSIRKQLGYNSSKLETIIKKYLIDFNLLFKTQFFIKYKRNKWFFYDFLLEDYNLILEIQGDYWHCNPLIYKENDIVNFVGGNKLVKDVWAKDIFKKRIAEKNGFILIELWENEIKNFKSEFDLLNLILNKLERGNNENNESKINKKD